MSLPGYYRFPTIHGELIVFVCEDDLWAVPASGGVARRLTANPGSASAPALSPDGAQIAFTGRDEGHAEVYVMPAAGGEAARLTFLGANTRTLGWTPDGAAILFATDAGMPNTRVSRIFAVPQGGGEPRLIPCGPAVSFAYGPGGAAVLCRNSLDPARWKRYRGGLTGDMWVDPAGAGAWRRLIRLAGNVAIPLWLGERICFVSDHEGVGNLYSCLPTGEELRRHSHHADYYARFPATDGRRIVYHAGADLFVYDPAADLSRRVEVELHSPRAQRKRKFVDGARSLQSYALHPAGHSLAIVARGKPFSLGCWEGAAVQHGDPGPARYRAARYLHDGRRLVAVGDGAGEETLELFTADTSAPPERLDGLLVGRPFALAASPRVARVAIANHRNELLLVDLDARTLTVLDRSRHAPIRGVAWSPDGRWLAYDFANSQQTTQIRLCELETGTITEVTRPVLRDVAPAFDPDGKYLYFISEREFDPVYDDLHFDLGFVNGSRPYLVTLRADLPSPFVAVPRPLEKPAQKNGAEPRPEQSAEPAADEAGEQKPPTKQQDEPLRIDLEGIGERVIAFPVAAGRYRQIAGIPGKVLYTVFPVEGVLDISWDPEVPPKGRLVAYDLEGLSSETLVDGIGSFALSLDRKTMACNGGGRLRVVKAGVKVEDKGREAGRKTGWVDLGRVRVSVSPPDEWCQMYREAWRLQREHFWNPEMSGVDWQAVYDRYLPLLDRVATRGEFTDLLWEMQGELGTSHAYAMGGDERPEPRYRQGKLAADLRYDEATDSYVIERIARGDSWDERASSPLARAGVGVREGDRLVAVNGRPLGRALPPGALLVNQAGQEVLLTVATAAGERRTVTVKALGEETYAYYREWVEQNRRMVHVASGGRVGYVHIPDMMGRGYAEFHRGFLAESGRDGLVVDLRFNGGGHVSPLIAEKLARRRVGYAVTRWGEPSPYPGDSPAGPMVALTNEAAGSDGDIMSHVFKLMQLGPLIGKRTWGGVVGINVRDTLVDGGVVTQPEYSFWFEDVGWQVENYGTEPDIEVELPPQDAAAGRDPQLERAIAEALRLVEGRPSRPDFGGRPHLGLPSLPGGEAR